MANNFLKY